MFVRLNYLAPFHGWDLDFVTRHELNLCCAVEIISLTPRFNAVNLERAQEKPFKRFFLCAHLSHPAEAGC
jgi:hypothetical protein